MLSSLVALLVVASAPVPGSFSVVPSSSLVKFHLHHTMHEVDGRSTQIEGKAVVGADGRVLTMIRIPVASFETGDGNRDAHMRQTLEAGKFPFVVFKGVTGLTLPVALGKPLETRLQGELEFHGVKHPVDLPATVQFGDGGAIAVHAKFPVSLDAYKIERPALLFVKVDDDVQLDVKLELEAAR
jgi:polyisoprenoid-binding protein YceI